MEPQRKDDEAKSMETSPKRSSSSHDISSPQSKRQCTRNATDHVKRPVVDGDNDDEIAEGTATKVDETKMSFLKNDGERKDEKPPFSVNIDDDVIKTISSFDVSQHVLRILTLKNVNLNATLDEILSSCLTLESLTLDACNVFRELTIHSNTLKSFTIRNMVVDVLRVYAFNVEVIEIDTVDCSPEDILLETPKLQVLRTCSTVKSGERHNWPDRLIPLTSMEIVDSCKYIQNLLTLCIDLDLKRVRNAITLFSALKSCPMLQNLEINSQVNNDSSDDFRDENTDEENYILPYPNTFYWRIRELCECIDHQLKTLCIKGFSGMPIEVEFLKYIITTAEKMNRISVWFVDNCPWSQAVETQCVLAFSKASENLAIVLNPGPAYKTTVGGNFQQWLSTLRD